jgi:hypothetical protein
MPSVTELSRTLQTFFGSLSERLARQTGFVRRQSKLTGSRFALIMVLGFLQLPKASYNNLAEVAFELGLSIKRQGLEDRTTPAAVAFMSQLFKQSLKLLQTKLGLPVDLLQHFPAVYLLDSTQVALPASLAATYPSSGGAKSPAGVKFQVVWELLSGQIAQLSAQPGTASDAKYSDYQAQMPKGSLILFDLGYVVLGRLAELKAANYYYLCRFNPQSHVYLGSEPSPLDLLAYLKKSEASTVDLELEVGKTIRLKSRLIGVKLPDEIVQQRRQKALDEAREKGRPVPTSSLEWLEWGLYLTNLAGVAFSVSTLVLLYRLRWQVELVFKLCKSGLGLDKGRGRQGSRVWVELYAKLIGLVLLTYLSAPVRWQEFAVADSGESRVVELSGLKALQSLQHTALDLGQALHRGSLNEIEQVVAGLIAKWQRFGVKEYRKKRPTTLQQVWLQAQARDQPDQAVGPPLASAERGEAVT